MQVASTRSAVVVGVTAHLIEAQAQVANGLPRWTIVGLPDTSVSESRERVRAATLSSGLRWPDSRITVALSPASLPKRGSGLDLAIALAVQCAAGAVPMESAARVARWVLVGELALDGQVRPVGSVLAAAVAARRAGVECLVVPEANLQEAALVPDLEVVAVSNLGQLLSVVRGDHLDPASGPASGDFEPCIGDASPTDGRAVGGSAPDLADVRGQAHARRALTVAASGGHHLSMTGAPGVGKTLLASCLPGLLPDLDDECALETTAIRSLMNPGSPAGLVRRPPVQAPHHTTTAIALIGGGAADRPTIGLVTAAHNGVLLLDEAAEFPNWVLESLRQAVESGVVSIARGGFQVTLPARCQLVLTSNPCPCGRALDVVGAPCRCSSIQRRRYRSKLSGPLFDRIDLRLGLTRPTPSELEGGWASGTPSSVIVEQVQESRERAARRLRGTPWHVNAAVPGHVVRSEWPISAALQRALDRLTVGAQSVRGLDVALRVAWTLADLNGSDQPGAAELREAMELRGVDAWAA